MHKNYAAAAVFLFDDYIPDYEGVMRACDEFRLNSNFRIIDKRWFVSARKL